MGDITLIRANRLGGTGWLKNLGPKANDLLNQLDFGRVQLYWVGSGHMVDYLIHQIDECCWIKDAWPVEAVGFGGRVPESRDCGQNLDVYSIEYTFADGAKAFCGFRRINATRTDFATYIHGTKCAAQFSGNIHAATVHRYKDQRIDKDNIVWSPAARQVQPLAIRMERLHREHPPRPAAQRSPPGGLLGPDHADGPRGLPHRPDRDLGADDEVRTSSSATTSTSSAPTAGRRSKRARTASSRFPFRACGRKSERSAVFGIARRFTLIRWAGCRTFFRNSP